MIKESELTGNQIGLLLLAATLTTSVATPLALNKLEKVYDKYASRQFSKKNKKKLHS